MQTPCISICSIHPASGLCTGCGRTLEEIGSWSSLSDEQRRSLMDILPLRLNRGALLNAGTTAEQTA